MIKEVLNTIRNGSHPSNTQLASNSLADQSAETQGFFGKMLTAFQQEDQISEGEQQFTRGKSVLPEMQDEESKEGREAVKQALMNLMGGAESGVHKIQNQENAETAILNEEPKNPDEILAMKLEVRNTEEGKTQADASESNLKGNTVSATSTEVNPLPAESGKAQEILNTEQPNGTGTVSKVLAESGKMVEGATENAANNKVVTNSDQKLNPELQTQAEGTAKIGSEQVVQNSEKATTEENKIPAGQKADVELNQSSGKQEAAELINRDNAQSGAVKQENKLPKVALFNDTQAAPKEEAPQNERVGQQYQQMSQKQVSKNELNSQLHLQHKVKAQEANEERSKRYDLQNQNADGKSISGDRLEAAAGASSGGNQKNSSFSSAPNWFKFQSAAQQKAGGLNDQQQAILDEHMKEVTDSPDEVSSERTTNGMNRLGEMPVQNALIRRSVLPGLTSILQKATSSGKEIAQNWQKHSFDLDDGKKIELSTRNVDGVIQLKIASSNHELNKLLQQYGQEIREHLEKECELTIDLQLNDNTEDNLSGFFNDSSSSGNKGRAGISRSPGTSGAPRPKTEGQIQQSVRRFGYNQMEWTV